MMASPSLAGWRRMSKDERKGGGGGEERGHGHGRGGRARTVRLLEFKGTGSSTELGCLHTNNAIIESSLYPYPI